MRGADGESGMEDGRWGGLRAWKSLGQGAGRLASVRGGEGGRAVGGVGWVGMGFGWSGGG